MIITILITIYILSFLRMYFWNKNAFSKDGIFSSSEPDLFALLFTIIPLLNTIAAVYSTVISLTGKKNDLDFYKFSKFFNVKK